MSSSSEILCSISTSNNSVADSISVDVLFDKMASTLAENYSMVKVTVEFEAFTNCSSAYANP